MRILIALALVALVGGMLGVSHAAAQESFAKQVGPVQAAPVKGTAPLTVPYITWGGDMATFYANGGLETKPGTLFQQKGLNLKLVPGDDFAQQVRDYMAGKSPFLRGTFSMIGMASEVIGSTEGTKGVVLLQMTWSKGDHMVGRKGLDKVKQMRGKTICLQQGGPHVGMLDDILETAELGWEDIKVVWAKDLTASDNSPAALFRKNPNIDACFVITPDMAGLCGGLDTVGRNVEGQVEGSHVVISTADLSQSIADVYVCRKDFFEANRDLVTRFVTGYLKACEEVGKLRADYEAKKPAPKYKELLELTQTIYGKETIPSLDDAHGLLCDCDMVIWPGNVKFFTWGEGNLRGFEVFHKRALELAVALKYATKKVSLAKAEFDYQSDAFKKDLENTKLENPTPVEVTPDQLRAAIKAEASSGPKVIVSFEINFDVGRDDFPARRYGENFLKVVTESARWAGAAFVIRGHTDPTKAIHDLALAGVKKGLIQERRKTDGTVEYLYGGKPLDQAVVKEIMRLVQEGRFEGTVDEKGMPISPLATVQAANNLSLERAQAVRAAILRYANDRGYRLNEMQLQPTGAGIAEPLVPVPTTDADAAKNRRVQFLLITVPAEEAVSPGK